MNQPILQMYESNAKCPTSFVMKWIWKRGGWVWNGLAEEWGISCYSPIYFITYNKNNTLLLFIPKALLLFWNGFIHYDRMNACRRYVWVWPLVDKCMNCWNITCALCCAVQCLFFACETYDLYHKSSVHNNYKIEQPNQRKERWMMKILYRNPIYFLHTRAQIQMR